MSWRAKFTYAVAMLLLATILTFGFLVIPFVAFQDYGDLPPEASRAYSRLKFDIGFIQMRYFGVLVFSLTGIAVALGWLLGDLLHAIEAFVLVPLFRIPNEVFRQVFRKSERDLWASIRASFWTLPAAAISLVVLVLADVSAGTMTVIGAMAAIGFVGANTFSWVWRASVLAPQELGFSRSELVKMQRVTALQALIAVLFLMGAILGIVSFSAWLWERMVDGLNASMQSACRNFVFDPQVLPHVAYDEPAQGCKALLFSRIAYSPGGLGALLGISYVLIGVVVIAAITVPNYLIWRPSVRTIFISLATAGVLAAYLVVLQTLLRATVSPIVGGLSLLALDELDMVAPKERSTILYNLSAVPKLGLIGITYRVKALAELNSRVTSRLNPIVLSVDAYGRKDILTILNARVETGLFPVAWSEDAVARIATLAEGNARTAVQTLRNAVFLAERKRDRKLLSTHVDESWAGSGDLRKRHHLDGLTPHHRLIHELVLTQGVVASGDLRSRYVEDCAQRNLKAVAPRTFSDYLRKLVTLGLLKEEVLIDEGRKRQFRPGNQSNMGDGYGNR